MGGLGKINIMCLITHPCPAPK